MPDTKRRSCRLLPLVLLLLLPLLLSTDYKSVSNIAAVYPDRNKLRVKVHQAGGTIEKIYLLADVPPEFDYLQEFHSYHQLEQELKLFGATIVASSDRAPEGSRPLWFAVALPADLAASRYRKFGLVGCCGNHVEGSVFIWDGADVTRVIISGEPYISPEEQFAIKRRNMTVLAAAVAFAAVVFLALRHRLRRQRQVFQRRS
jgi:hypothetical protein